MCIHLGSFPFHLMRCAALSSFFVFAESLLTVQAIQEMQGQLLFSGLDR